MIASPQGRLNLRKAVASGAAYPGVPPAPIVKCTVRLGELPSPKVAEHRCQFVEQKKIVGLHVTVKASRRVNLRQRFCKLAYHRKYLVVFQLASVWQLCRRRHNCHYSESRIIPTKGAALVWELRKRVCRPRRTDGIIRARQRASGCQAA